MVRTICLKTVINKMNKQINVSLPKKEMQKELKVNPEKLKNIKIKIIGYDLWR